MDTKEVESLKRSRQEEYQKDMEAIERVLRMLNGSNGHRMPAKGAISREMPDLPDQTKTSPTAAVRESYATLPDVFSLVDIRIFLTKHHPSVPQDAGTLTPALRRMVSQKIIEVVSPGSSNNPTRYRKLKK